MTRQKLKILYVVTKSNSGGAQHYVYDLATNIPKEMFEPVVAFGGAGPLKEKLEAAGITTVSIAGLERDIGALREFRAFFNLLRIISNTRPDIVHLNSSKAGALGALGAFILNIFNPLLYFLRLSTFNFQLKTIFTVHGWAFKEKRGWLAKKIIKCVSWFTVFLSHRTIVVSRDDREKVRNFFLLQRKIVLIHNGILNPTFKDKKEAREVIGRKGGLQTADEKCWIGSVAELHGNKGLDFAIRAIHRIASDKMTKKEFAYVIVGGGEEKEHLRLLVAEEKLEDKVVFTGEIAGAAELLRAFDIFLLPSLKEGLPYVLLEAGAAGLASIATNVGGVPEVIEDMKSGIIIKPKRPKEMADALAFLMEHDEKRKEFGDRLRRKVADSYDLKRFIKETVAVYADKR